MAAIAGAAITGAFQGYQQYQDNKRKRELEAIDLMTRQQQLRLEQQKADLQQQQALRANRADENAASLLQGFYGGSQGSAGAQPPAQMPPPQPQGPQATPIGQASVPMQQPGARPPIPPGGVQGSMPPPGTPPLPPTSTMPPQARQPAPQQPPPVPPYKRIGEQQPAPPQQQAPQQPAQIPQQAPAENSLTFEGAVRQLQAKGIQGPALVDALDRIKPYLDQEAKQQAASLKQQLEIQKASLAAAKFERDGKHQEALEANGAARLALEEQRLRIEASAKATSAEQGNARLQLEKDRIEQAKIPTGYQRGKDGKLEPMPGGPYDKNSPNYRAPKSAAKGGSIADRMNPTMLASVKLDIEEGRNALDQIKQLTTDTTGAFFAHDHASPLATIMGRAVTSEQQQKYEVAMNRIAVAIASVQSMGRGQISDAKVNEARKLVPQPGDKPATRQFKIQQISKIMDLAERTLNSPSGGNPAEPDGDRAAATAGSVPGGGNQAPKTVNWSDLK